MKTVLHYTLLLLAVLFGPKLLGLVDSNSTLYAYVFWGFIFGGIGSLVLQVVLKKL